MPPENQTPLHERLMGMIALPLAYYEYSQEAAAYADGEFTVKDHIFQMINGGFGSFVMVMMGLGGLATLFITREGKAGTRVPIWGVLMVIVAIIMFALRVGIKSGLFGHEYLQW